MPGIFSSLNAAASALQTHSRSVQQTGKNIANVNTEGYTRQRLTTGTIASSNGDFKVDSGALVALGAEQKRDVFIDRQIISEISYLQTLETQDFRLRQALANLGDSIDRSGEAQFVDDLSQTSGGLRGSIDKFFNSFQALAARPNDATTRQVLFQSAEALVDNFNRVDSRFEIMQGELDNQLSVELDSFNQRLAELDEINREIGRLEVAQPGAALDLRDKRQQKLEELAEYALIDSKEVPGANGQIVVNIRSENGDSVPLVEPGEGVREIYFDDASGGFRVLGQGTTLDIESGRLPAVAEIRDVNVANIRAELDQLANTVATEVNELYYQEFVPAGGGDPAVPEESFFQMPTPPPSVSGTPATVTAGTIALYSEPSDPVTVTDFTPLSVSSLRTSDTEFEGANDLALAMADLGNANMAALGNIKMSEFSARMVTELGQEIEEIQNRQSVQQDVKDILEQRRGEVGGVSMDEEVSNLVQYQRAFQASSRFFNVLSEMLDTMINTLGR
jgi:flagellar hook-associated protein 1 FlgK